MDVTTDDSIVILLMSILCILLVWQAAWQLVRLTSIAAMALVTRFPRSQVLERTHPLRATLERRLPRSYGFLMARLTPQRFDGLPLTLVAVAALYLAFLLGGLIEEVVEAEEIVRFDAAVGHVFDPYRTPFLVALFSWTTDLGAMPALVLVSVVSTGFLWTLYRAFLILPLWVTILGAHATTWIGKFGFDRDRPEFQTMVTALSPSFPSAHATGSMAVLGFTAYLITRDLRRPRERFEVIFWTGILIAMISFSRIFLAVHHASDVAAGLLVGGFWLLVGIAIAEQLRLRRV
jgi:membrane-associated phospholipid phosphatase